MHVTQKEIADKLGVSRQLVTFALSGSGTVSDQKRREILEVAEQMGYRRNELARAMVTGKSRILGVLTDKDMGGGTMQTISGALEEATAHGYSTKLMFLPWDADDETAKGIVSLCSTWRLDGVLVVGLSDHHVEILRDEMKSGDRPVAFVGSIPPEDGIGAWSDDTDAVQLAVQHLLSLEHRRFAHLGANPDSKLARTRLFACLQVFREFGLEVDEHSSVFASWNEPESIMRGIHFLLDAPKPPTAILCSGDSAAMVAVRVARKRGLRVPEDLSVVGFGNHSDSKFFDPPLTTIAQPHEEVAQIAVRQLIGHLEQKDDVAFQGAVRLEKGHQLIVRESTAPPRGAPD